MIRKWLGVMVAGVVLAGVMAHAGLETVGGRSVDIEYWTGSGTNSAVMVLDFGPGMSYGFGYRWDGPAVDGYVMLSNIADAGGVDIEVTDYGWGILVDSVSFKGRVMGALYGYPSNWVAFFEATTGDDWVASYFGAQGTLLVNGGWYGWSRQSVESLPPDYLPTYAPTTSPEHMIVLKGVELPIVAKERDTEWEDSRAAICRLYASVYYDQPAADGTIKVAGVEVRSFGIDRSMETATLDGGELVLSAGGKLAGYLDDSMDGDVAAGIFTGSADALGTPSSLNGTLMMIGRNADGMVETFSRSTWWLKASRTSPGVTTLSNRALSPEPSMTSVRRTNARK